MVILFSFLLISTHAQCVDDSGDFGYISVLSQGNGHLIGRIGKCIYVNKEFKFYFDNNYGCIKFSKSGDSYIVHSYGNDKSSKQYDIPITTFAPNYKVYKTAQELPHHIGYAIMGCEGDEQAKPMIIFAENNVIPWASGSATITVSGNMYTLTYKYNTVNGIAQGTTTANSGTCFDNLKIYVGKYTDKTSNGVTSIFMMILVILLILL